MPDAELYPKFLREPTRTDGIFREDYSLSVLLERIPPVESAIDVGCGVGTWLSVLSREKGVKHICGVDGSWVDRGLLEISDDCFMSFDLVGARLKLPRRYDLAISLEVAEHLPPSRANEFVLSLTELSDFVLFSAAIPSQGGRNHINEQWPSYWVELFAARDYVATDFIRRRIWNDKKLPFWYRQNALLFSAKKAELAGDDAAIKNEHPLDIVHPDCYALKARADSVQGSLLAVARAVKRRFTAR